MPKRCRVINKQLHCYSEAFFILLFELDKRRHKIELNALKKRKILIGNEFSVAVTLTFSKHQIRYWLVGDFVDSAPTEFVFIGFVLETESIEITHL